jgi:uncharacterized protein (TIGR02145 family)
MESRKIIWILILTLSISLFSCKPEEIILHGELSGTVTDAITSQPLENATVIITQLNDTTLTDSEGKYSFKNLVPSNYEINAMLSPAYAIEKKSIAVAEAELTELNFELNGVPKLKSSAFWLNFGLDSTFKSFTISNIGKGKLSYALVPYKNWITIDPLYGEVTTKTDTIKVTVNRTGLPFSKHVEIIKVISFIENGLHIDTISVLVNGVLDRDQNYNSKLKNYYGVVTIGTQTWLAENLNTGSLIPVTHPQADNGIIEKWGYDCKTYGGFYNWHEMMQYNPPDVGAIGTTQGICPAGWHIPTQTEAIALSLYLGGNDIAGGKLKATTTLWYSPNVGATNESGFSALPAGSTWFGDDWLDQNPSDNNFGEAKGWEAAYWDATLVPPVASCGCPELGECIDLGEWTASFSLNKYPSNWGMTVRCIKDPPKK